MKRIFALLMAAVLALGVMALAGCGQEKVDKLLVGLDDSFPPMGFRDDDNNIVGFDIDLATEAAKRMGVEVEFVPIGWGSKDMELSSGNVNCLWNGFTMDGREDDYTFSEPYMRNHQVLVVLADSPYQTLDDLAGKKLALQEDSSASRALDAHPDFKEKLANVVTFEDNLKALLDLDIGQSDAVLMDEVVAQYNIENKGDGYRILGEPLAEENYGVGFKKGNKSLRDQVQKALEEMAADGTLAKISEKWFSKDVTVIGKD